MMRIKVKGKVREVKNKGGVVSTSERKDKEEEK